VTRVAVVSAVYGGYDEPAPPPPQDVPCDWILVSDRDYDVWPWKVTVEPRPQLHPRLAAKVPKAHPEWYADADVYIWIDGNLVVEAPDFVSWCVGELGGASLAQHHSLERTSLIAEAHTAAGMEKYSGLPVVAQAERYVAGGYPENWGLWWTGLMVRSAGCPNFGDAWLAEMVRWTYEDQVSEPYVLHSAGLRPTNLAIDWSAKRFHLRGHRDTR
jgi:hypothetical protein